MKNDLAALRWRAWWRMTNSGHFVIRTPVRVGFFMALRITQGA
ncbi:MAG TPA: hypothetical protein PKA16_03540 [Ottowia sp.]|nr:hypothetical protein [Ottowia sp.]HMN20447.1 hypothetical protein [Ottowia sp.]